MNSAKPYIGCKIALISKTQNRYVGALYTIDEANSTVVLANVKCFGTEDRLAERPTPPRDDIYEFIIFRGNDIKDISLCEQVSSQHGLPPDPAILLSSGAIVPAAHSTLNLGAVQVPVYHRCPSQPLHKEDYATALGLGIPIKRPMVEKAVQTIGIERSQRFVLPSDEEWEQRAVPVRPSVRQPLPRQPAKRQAIREPLQQGPPTATRGVQRHPPPRRDFDYRQNIDTIPPRRRQGPWRGNNHTDPTLRFDMDFDFDNSNAQFLKDDQMQGGVEPSDSLFEPNRFYNKAKSFYDNISSDRKIRLSWDEERQRNLETFGASGRPLRGLSLRGSFSRGRGHRPGVFAD